MHRIKTYMDKIIEKGSKEDMEKIEDYFYKLMCEVHMNKPEMTNWIKEEMMILANGKILTEDMVDMDNFKWDLSETDLVMTQYGWILPSVEFNYVANKYYDMWHEIEEDDTKILKMAHKKLTNYPESAFNMWLKHKK